MAGKVSTRVPNFRPLPKIQLQVALRQRVKKLLATAAAAALLRVVQALLLTLLELLHTHHIVTFLHHRITLSPFYLSIYTDTLIMLHKHQPPYQSHPQQRYHQQLLNHLPLIDVAGQRSQRDMMLLVEACKAVAYGTPFANQPLRTKADQLKPLQWSQ